MERAGSITKGRETIQRFRDPIKDEVLASEAVEFEKHPDLAPEDRRRRIAKAVSRRYNAPAPRRD